MSYSNPRVPIFSFSNNPVNQMTNLPQYFRNVPSDQAALLLGQPTTPVTFLNPSSPYSPFVPNIVSGQPVLPTFPTRGQSPISFQPLIVQTTPTMSATPITSAASPVSFTPTIPQQLAVTVPASPPVQPSALLSEPFPTTTRAPQEETSVSACRASTDPLLPPIPQPNLSCSSSVQVNSGTIPIPPTTRGIAQRVEGRPSVERDEIRAINTALMAVPSVQQEKRVIETLQQAIGQVDPRYKTQSTEEILSRVKNREKQESQDLQMQIRQTEAQEGSLYYLIGRIWLSVKNALSERIQSFFSLFALFDESTVQELQQLQTAEQQTGTRTGAEQQSWFQAAWSRLSQILPSGLVSFLSSLLQRGAELTVSAITQVVNFTKSIYNFLSPIVSWLVAHPTVSKFLLLFAKLVKQQFCKYVFFCVNIFAFSSLITGGYRSSLGLSSLNCQPLFHGHKTLTKSSRQFPLTCCGFFSPKSYSRL